MRLETLTSTFALAFALSLTAGCNNEPGEGKTAATVSEPLAAKAPSASGKKLVFSDADSKIDWVGAKVTRKHDGQFQKFQGAIDLVDGDPTKSSVDVQIEMASVMTDEDHLLKHLKTPDLLDVEKFPKARFTSTSIVAGGANGATHTVTGNLLLHGVTKAITFPATIRVSEQGATLDSEFVINRKDFGIVYPGMPDDLIKDDVLLKLQVRAKPAV